MKKDYIKPEAEKIKFQTEEDLLSTEGPGTFMESISWPPAV